MSEYAPGDVVTVQGRKRVRFDADSPSGTVWVELEINGSLVRFEHEVGVGETSEQVVDALLVELANGQTAYALEDDGEGFVVEGRPGEDFAHAASAGFVEAVEAEAVEVLSEDGSRVRDLLVIQSENSWLGPTAREFWTKDPRTGEVTARNVLRVRELDTGNEFDLDAADVRAFVSRASGA